jgi:hypothetical protein
MGIRTNANDLPPSFYMTSEPAAAFLESRLAVIERSALPELAGKPKAKQYKPMPRCREMSPRPK